MTAGCYARKSTDEGMSTITLPSITWNDVLNGSLMLALPQVARWGAGAGMGPGVS